MALGLNTTKEFLEFIRFKICIFITSIGISGYLLFNEIEFCNILFILSISFFVVGGSYAINNMTDYLEDLINRKKVNKFVSSKIGWFVIIIFFSLGILLAFLHSLFSFALCSVAIFLGVVYSLFKLKRYMLVKNLYTAVGAGLVFLLGATYISAEVMFYYSLFTFFIFIGSMISDLRDYEGDKVSKIKTLPVALGYELCKKINIFLLVSFSLIVFFSKLILLIPFIGAMIYFVYKNRPELAHSCEGISFIFLAFWLLL